MFFFDVGLKIRLLVINLLIEKNGQKNKKNNRKRPYINIIIVLNAIFLYYTKMDFFTCYKIHKNEIIYNQMKRKPNACLQEKNMSKSQYLK